MEFLCYHVVQHICIVKVQSEWQSIPCIWASRVKIGAKQSIMAQVAALALLLYFALLFVCFRTDTVLVIVRVTMAIAVACFGNNILEKAREFCHGDTWQTLALLLIQEEDGLPPKFWQQHPGGGRHAHTPSAGVATALPILQPARSGAGQRRCASPGAGVGGGSEDGAVPCGPGAGLP